MTEPTDPMSSPYAGLASKIRSGKSAAQAEYDSTPPALSVLYTRPQSGLFLRCTILGVFDNLFGAIAIPLRIEIDGQIAGTLYPKDKIVVELEPGEHQLRVLGLWMKSAKKPFHLTNGQRIKFWCQSAWLGIILQRDHG